jgi:hypothetical protein
MDADYFRLHAGRIRAAMADCTDQRISHFLDSLAQEFEERGRRSRARCMPGEPVPVTGIYAQMNAKGARTGVRIHAALGECLPPAPPGFTWLFIRRQE